MRWQSVDPDISMNALPPAGEIICHPDRMLTPKHGQTAMSSFLTPKNNPICPSRLQTEDLPGFPLLISTDLNKDLYFVFATKIGFGF